VARDQRSNRTLRGALQIAVVVAVLSLILPGRGITLFLVALVVGFAFGLAAEAVFARRRR
jgi:Na+(H+)/acetate symporter ActP